MCYVFHSACYMLYAPRLEFIDALLSATMGLANCCRRSSSDVSGVIKDIDYLHRPPCDFHSPSNEVQYYWLPCSMLHKISLGVAWIGAACSAYIHIRRKLHVGPHNLTDNILFVIRLHRVSATEKVFYSPSVLLQPAFKVMRVSLSCLPESSINYGSEHHNSADDFHKWRCKYTARPYWWW